MWASGICSRVILYIYSEFRLSGHQELPVPRNKKAESAVGSTEASRRALAGLRRCTY